MGPDFREKFYPGVDFPGGKISGGKSYTTIPVPISVIPDSVSAHYLSHTWRFSNEIRYIGSVPVDFLRPKFRVAHTKHDVISILMNKYTYINMYIIKKIISCIFILC